MKRYGISFIGAGRLGRSLGRRLREKGWKIHSVVTRSSVTARRAVRSIGAGQPETQVSENTLLASIILIAVPDSVIKDIVQQLAAFGTEQVRGHVVLHTSGALNSETLAPLRALGAVVASFHPLQTFSGVGVPNLEGRVFAVEGDAQAVRICRAATRVLGGRLVVLRPSAKAAYHAAASISAGMVLSLMETSVRIFVSLGMSRKEALRALLPLTRQVLENEEALGAQAAWTGPLARGDYGVIASHENALHAFPEEYLEAYRAMNRLSARVLARDPESVLNELKHLPQPELIHQNARGTNA